MSNVQAWVLGPLCLPVRWLLNDELVETICFEYHAEEDDGALPDYVEGVYARQFAVEALYNSDYCCFDLFSFVCEAFHDDSEEE
jgi:hypothetical protein